MVRIGIVGTAGIARLFFGGVLRHAQFVAVASRSPERAAAFAAEHGLSRWYDSYEALLADPAIDALYIPLPNHLHAEYAVKAAQAGKHILVEKPAAPTPADFAKMTDAADTAGVVLMEGLMWRFKEVHRRAFAIAAEGSLGRVRHVDFCWSFPARFLGRGLHRMDPACAGGALNDVGVYGADFLHRLLGHEMAVVQGRIWKETPAGVDVMCHAILAGGDVTASFTCGYAFDANYYVIACERGMIQAPGSVSGRVTENVLRIHSVEGDRWTEERFAPENPYHRLLDHFAACVLGEEKPAITPGETRRNLDLLERIRNASSVTLTSSSG